VFPFCVVRRFEFFLRLHVKGAPASVEVLEDLVGCDVAVRRQSVAELGIKLLVEGIAEVVDHTTQETFSAYQC